MNNTRRICFALALTLAAGSAAADESALPPVQHQGAVAYVSGGIGQDQSQAMKAASRHYPLNLQFAIHRDGKDEFAADAQVEIRDAAGKTVLGTRADGPFLLVDLPAGRYHVQATTSGHAQQKDVEIVTGNTRELTFVWPADQVDSASR